MFSKAFSLAKLKVKICRRPCRCSPRWVARSSAQALPFLINRFAQLLSAEVLILGAVDATV
ncbi:hypothetical protein BG74_04695 [Sodalis-like endosymbiont of Proechinophthirus fluctus]|uniref:hypothetical protein n=1 Tax=Sodalis-like endosymbiont of Proechinophthirus fluctus TaxID=1462730 RepID=UPI0007A85B1C|nr:hypothetical protein [Sodalis-like endosymbiont of Proechinophthirus fluctus]KYP97260.1 hypothetical protein BG74_04695 [Sodalis-like endosymbiont of Proechinophthirus fluctus]